MKNFFLNINRIKKLIIDKFRLQNIIIFKVRVCKVREIQSLLVGIIRDACNSIKVGFSRDVRKY